MSTKQITPVTAGFESLKQTNAHDAEYWRARDLQPLLGYAQWRRFEQAIERAMTSCGASGNQAAHHFAGAGKPIVGGKGAVQVVDDYQLSRFACYLIAQNGDARKPEIAHAQQYFAIQTRRQELSDQAAADVERLGLRKQTAEEFKALSGAAQDAGVQSKMFGVFHDAGYKGLYGGLGRARPMVCWVERPSHDRHGFLVPHRPALQAAGGGDCGSLFKHAGRPGQRAQSHHEAMGQAPGAD